MTDDDFQLLKTRRNLEEQGLKWSGNASVGMVMGVAQPLTNSINVALKRIKELEQRIEGMQKKLDHVDKHALIFAGDWQTESTYHAGHLVRFKGATYTALRTVIPGREAPDRAGTGWSRVT